MLEEKKVPYEMKLIDVSNKPDWSVRPSPSPLLPPLEFQFQAQSEKYTH
jgi:hypothetical protein